MQVPSHLIFYRHLSRQLADMRYSCETAHTSQADIVFFSAKGEKNAKLTPHHTAPDPVCVITPASNEGRSVCGTLSCCSAFPHLNYFAVYRSNVFFFMGSSSLTL